MEKNESGIPRLEKRNRVLFLNSSQVKQKRVLPITKILTRRDNPWFKNRDDFFSKIRTPQPERATRPIIFRDQDTLHTKTDEENREPENVLEESPKLENSEPDMYPELNAIQQKIEEIDHNEIEDKLEDKNGQKSDESINDKESEIAFSEQSILTKSPVIEKSNTSSTSMIWRISSGLYDVTGEKNPDKSSLTLFDHQLPGTEMNIKQISVEDFRNLVFSGNVKLNQDPECIELIYHLWIHPNSITKNLFELVANDPSTGFEHIGLRQTVLPSNCFPKK